MNFKETELRVELIAHTPNPEKVITAGAKLCYSQSTIQEIMKKNTDDVIARFLNMIMKIGHGSILEHAVFTFGIEGVSRITEVQILRHRTASPSVQSGRYVLRDNPEFAVPPRIKNNPRAYDKYIKQIESSQKAYLELIDIMKEEYPTLDIKAIIEDARYVHAQSLGTKILFTIDLRNLIHLISERRCKRAQWEAQAIAGEMIKLIEPLLPNIGKYIGAPCELGKCSEGSMTCKEPYQKK